MVGARGIPTNTVIKAGESSVIYINPSGGGGGATAGSSKLIIGGNGGSEGGRASGGGSYNGGVSTQSKYQGYGNNEAGTNSVPPHNDRGGGSGASEPGQGYYGGKGKTSIITGKNKIYS